MTPPLTRNIIALVLAALVASGCGPAIRDGAPDGEPAPTQTRTEPMNSPAVVELATQARQALRDSRHDTAVQLLERAIRIEPQNGELWHELARVRFQQGNYEQARQLANRSNALIAGDSTLKARNDTLIEKARNAESY